MYLRPPPSIYITEYEFAVLRAVASRKPANWETSPQYRLVCAWLREQGLIKRPNRWDAGDALHYVPSRLGHRLLKGAQG